MRGNNNRDRNREDRRHWTWSRSRERGARARSESVLDQDQTQELVQIEIESDVSNVESMIIFANECPNLVLEDSDKESGSARQASLQILADSDTGLEVEQF